MVVVLELEVVAVVDGSEVVVVVEDVVDVSSPVDDVVSLPVDDVVSLPVDVVVGSVVSTSLSPSNRNRPSARPPKRRSAAPISLRR